MSADPIQLAAESIHKAKHTVAFTGAGISTHSGIPDFRSAESGLWESAEPMEVASLFGFRQNPNVFFDWVRPLVQDLQTARPNAGHLALANMEQLGYLQAIITQNIDGLHAAAGNHTIHELHGHLRTATCTHCFTKYDAAPLIEALVAEKPLPTCPKEGAILKPDVILFGEQLPISEVHEAQRLLETTDLLLVIGSSLRVDPAGQIPFTAIRHGARVIIVNLEPTPADSAASLVIRRDVNEVLPEIMMKLENIR